MAEGREDYHGGVRIISRNHWACFTENLRECFNKEITADVILLVNSCPEDVAAGNWIPIQGNRCVLAAMSPVFRDILLSVPGTEETVLAIHMAGYSYSAVYGLVHFLYHGYCPLWVDVNDVLQILLDFKLVEEGTVDEHTSQQEKERERRLLLEEFFSEDEDGNQADCLEIGPFVETKLEFPAGDDCEFDSTAGKAHSGQICCDPNTTKEPRKRGRPRKTGNSQLSVQRSQPLHQHATRKSTSTSTEHSQPVAPRKRGRPRKDATKKTIAAATKSRAPPKKVRHVVSNQSAAISQNSAVTPVVINRPIDVEAVVSSVGGRFVPIKSKANVEDVPLKHGAVPFTFPVCPVENTALKMAIPALTETPLNPEGGTAVLSGIANAPACGYLIIVNNTQQPQDGGGGVPTKNEPTSSRPDEKSTPTGGTVKSNIAIAPRGKIPAESSAPATRYRCGTCDETFASEWDCQRHLKKHRYKCKYCDKTYPIVSQLRNHVRCHTKEKPFSCHVCQQSFSHRKTLDYHLTTHSSVRSHQCSICAKTFKRKCYLRLHMRMHTREKPYACPHCGKRFTQGCNMRKHMRTHQKGQPADKATADLVPAKNDSDAKEDSEVAMTTTGEL